MINILLCEEGTFDTNPITYIKKKKYTTYVGNSDGAISRAVIGFLHLLAWSETVHFLIGKYLELSF